MAEVKEELKETEPTYPLLYCGVCGLPIEYCEFNSKSWEKCKKWIVENCDFYSKVYPQLDENNNNTSTEKKEEPKAEKPKQKNKEKEKKVIIQTTARTKKKFVTIISGLQDFGVSDLKDASKQMSKKFACSASVVKNASNQDEIQIQGDLVDDLLDFLPNKFSVPVEEIEVKEAKKKKG